MSNSLKLSQDTVTILKNFSTINQTLQFQPGNVIRTKSRGGEVVATAKVAEDFPVSFSIYELGRFLSVLGLFQDATLEFGDTSVKISDGRNSVNYVYSDPSLITAADYSKKYLIAHCISSFDLKQDDLQKIQKAASVLGNPNISITAKDGELVMVSYDKKNPSCDRYSLSIGSTDAEDFTVELSLETLRFIPGDYRVEVGERIIVRFTNKANELEYLVAGVVSR